jgi:hypothetical protein
VIDELFARIADQLEHKSAEEAVYGRLAWEVKGSRMRVRVDDWGHTVWTFLDRHGSVTSERTLPPGLDDSAYT